MRDVVHVFTHVVVLADMHVVVPAVVHASVHTSVHAFVHASVHAFVRAFVHSFIHSCSDCVYAFSFVCVGACVVACLACLLDRSIVGVTARFCSSAFSSAIRGVGSALRQFLMLASPSIARAWPLQRHPRSSCGRACAWLSPARGRW